LLKIKGFRKITGQSFEGRIPIENICAY
jgi:hypothetical protein